ncbi:MAG: hypothetical protein V3W41_14430 [Planctomycetota bacterium]
MSSYPLGGSTITDNDRGAVELFDVVYDTDVFVPTTSARLYPAGTLLARLIADGKLTPFTTDNIPASSDIVGVLGSDVQAALLAEVNLRYIVSGQVKLSKLSIDDTSASVVITDAIKDEMRQTGIIPLSSAEQSHFDNPNNP